jgi:hypothetical protein
MPKPGTHAALTTLALALTIALPTRARAEPPAPGPAPAAEGWGAEDEVGASQPAAPAPAPAPATISAAPTQPPVDEETRWRKHQRQRFRAMMISGFTTLGASYGASLLLGTIFIDIGREDDDARKVQYGTRMVIPIGGPFAAAAVSRSATGAVFTVAAGVGQVVGLTLGIVGAAKMRQYPDLEKKRFALGVSPTRGGAQAGLSMRF